MWSFDPFFVFLFCSLSVASSHYPHSLTLCPLSDEEQKILREIEANLRAGVQELQDDGLVTFDGDVLRVTPLGQLLVRNVAMLFDAYLPKHAGEKRPTFSRTV